MTIMSTLPRSYMPTNCFEMKDSWLRGQMPQENQGRQDAPSHFLHGFRCILYIVRQSAKCKKCKHANLKCYQMTKISSCSTPKVHTAQTWGPQDRPGPKNKIKIQTCFLFLSKMCQLWSTQVNKKWKLVKQNLWEATARHLGWKKNKSKIIYFTQLATFWKKRTPKSHKIN